jgi:tRNA1(Val) A37 N6-methylase TrmN6
MPEHAALPAEIERVGDEIHSSLPPDAPVLERAREWADSQGVDDADDPDRIICNLAAYNRLLKTTLYNLYQIDGPELDDITGPEDVPAKLTAAHKVTGDDAFGSFVLDDVADAVDPDVLNPLDDLRHRLTNADEPTEDIGRVFECLVPSNSRKELGQFRTPEHVAATMAEWAIRDGTDSVLDPGMGAGALTSALYRAKQRADGEQSVDEMHGIDLSQLSVVMSTTALKIVNGGGTPNFHAEDFLNAVAVGEVSRLVQTNGDLVKMPKVDAVVSNPPYSRHQDIGPKDKRDVNEIAQASAGMEFDLTSPMYVYFLVHATQFLDDGGRMAVITPSEWLENGYGKNLRAFLLDNYAIRGMVVYDPEVEVFDGPMTTACISFLERQDGGAGDCTTSFLRLSEWPGMQTVLDAVDGEVLVGRTEYGYLNRLPQTELLPERDWSDYLSPESVEELPELTPFHELADIKRGIATGNNDFFCLSESEVEECGISEEYRVKLIRRTNGLAYDLRDEVWEEWRDAGDEVWLLYCHDEENELIERHDIDDPAVEEYLDYGEEEGANEGYLVQKRNPWYRVEKRDPPPILVTYMSKSGFRFIRNQADVVSLNNLHNISFPEDTEYKPEEMNALLAYLNSDIVNKIVERSGREYGGGLHKIEPGELEHIPAIDPKAMHENDVSRLSDQFEKLTEAGRDDDGSLDEVVVELDTMIADILDIDP